MGKPAYDWNEWFRRLEWPDDRLDLVEGRDFQCSPAAMQIQFRRQAARRSLRIRTRIMGRGVLRVTPVFRADPLPWDSWFDGQPHTLVQGVDFAATMTARGLERQARVAAVRKGVRLSAVVRGNMIRLCSSTPVADPLLAVVAAAVADCEQRPYTLGEIEARLPDGPRARQLADYLMRLRWTRRRTSAARLWEPPLESSNVAA